MTHQVFRNLVLFQLCWFYCESQFNIPQELIKEKNIGGAGVKGRLSQKGVSYVTEFMVSVLIKDITTIELETESKSVKGQNSKFDITDHVLTVANSHSLKVRTSAPSRIAIDISVKDISLKGNLNGNSLNATFEVHPSNPLVNLNVSVLRKNGSPNIKVESCNVVTEEQIVILDLDSEPKTQLEENLSEYFDTLVCNRIKYLVEDRINVRLGLLSPKIPVAYKNESYILKDVASRMLENGQRLAKRDNQKALLSSFNMSRANSLFLDYTIVTDPFANEIGLEIWSSGEVSLNGKGDTPFGPIDVSLPDTANEEFMLKMAVSDFVPNSLMYHGHAVGLFNTKVDPSTPHFGPIMRTTCNLGTGLLFCLGDLFPTLRRLHPNHRLSLNFNTVQAPVIKFHPQSSGGIKFMLKGRIVILIVDNLNSGVETKVAEMSIDVMAHMKLRLSSTAVKPKITLDSIKLTTLSPGILLQDELDDAVLLSKEVLQRMVNDILQDGIPMPVHPLFKLNKPKVKVMDRALLLQTNIDLNAQLMRQLISADILKDNA